MVKGRLEVMMGGMERGGGWGRGVDTVEGLLVERLITPRWSIVVCFALKFILSVVPADSACIR